MDAAFSLERSLAEDNKKIIEENFNTLQQACTTLKDFMVRYSVKNLFMKFLLVDDEFDSRKSPRKCCPLRLSK